MPLSWKIITPRRRPGPARPGWRCPLPRAGPRRRAAPGARRSVSMIVLSVLEGIWMTHSGSIFSSAARTAALRWAGSLMAPPPRQIGAMSSTDASRADSGRLSGRMDEATVFAERWVRGNGAPRQISRGSWRSRPTTRRSPRCGPSGSRLGRRRSEPALERRGRARVRRRLARAARGRRRGPALVGQLPGPAPRLRARAARPGRSPCDRLRVELLLERADFGVVGASERGLVGWTKLVTPRVGAGAVQSSTPTVRILLTDRADGRGWCMPGGFSDPLRVARSRRSCGRRARRPGWRSRSSGLVGVYSVATPLRRQDRRLRVPVPGRRRGAGL